MNGHTRSHPRVETTPFPVTIPSTITLNCLPRERSHPQKPDELRVRCRSQLRSLPESPVPLHAHYVRASSGDTCRPKQSRRPSIQVRCSQPACYPVKPSFSGRRNASSSQTGEVVPNRSIQLSPRTHLPPSSFPAWHTGRCLADVLCLFAGRGPQFPRPGPARDQLPPPPRLPRTPTQDAARHEWAMWTVRGPRSRNQRLEHGQR